MREKNLLALTLVALLAFTQFGDFRRAVAEEGDRGALAFELNVMKGKYCMLAFGNTNSLAVTSIQGGQFNNDKMLKVFLRGSGVDRSNPRFVDVRA